MTKWFLTLFLGLLLWSNSHAEDLKQTMIRTGEIFNSIQTAVISEGDLGSDTLTDCRELTALFRQARSQVPNLDHITNDPIKQKELLAQYQAIMNQIITLAEGLESTVVDQLLQESLRQIKKLKETRKEAHAIFTQSTNGDPK
ncbi:MAG: hypothetical protein SGJ18_02575 [Pseudomonadota bacterium]|nr:hypothetical protein [Pseudomonadota bacterium]